MDFMGTDILRLTLDPVRSFYVRDTSKQNTSSGRIDKHKLTQHVMHSDSVHELKRYIDAHTPESRKRYEMQHANHVLPFLRELRCLSRHQCRTKSKRFAKVVEGHTGGGAAYARFMDEVSVHDCIQRLDDELERARRPATRFTTVVPL